MTAWFAEACSKEMNAPWNTVSQLLRRLKLCSSPDQTQPQPSTPSPSARFYENLKHQSREVDLKRSKVITVTDGSFFTSVRSEQMLTGSTWQALIGHNGKRETGKLYWKNLVWLFWSEQPGLKLSKERSLLSKELPDHPHILKPYGRLL